MMLLYLLFKSSVLVYQSSTGRTLQIEYPAIALHATSRGDSAPYVYCHIDEPPAADAPPPDADDTLISRVLMLTPQDPTSRAFRLIHTYASSDWGLTYSLSSRQWILSSRHFHIALLFIPILRDPTMEMTTTTTTATTILSIQIRLHLKFSLGMRARNSARSAGCAVLLLTITAISPTRHFLFFSPFSIVRFLCLCPLCHFAQAALAHLEGIIYDPYEQQRENRELSPKVNGTPSPEEGQFSDGEEPS